MIAEDGNASRQKRTNAVLRCVPQNLSKLRTKLASVRSVNGFSGDVARLTRGNKIPFAARCIHDLQ